MQIVTYSTKNLVKRHRGTMPIILTAPHGGSEQPPRVSARTGAPAGCDGREKFVVGRDDRTAEVTEAVAKRILETTGLSPYVVIAEFGRTFIDANRTEACAFTDRQAKPFYDEYHSRIDGYMKQILDQNGGRGFLFDIHGSGVQSDNPADIFLGTAHRRTLQEGYAYERLFAQHGLQGLLAWTRLPSLSGGKPFQFQISPTKADEDEFGPLSGGNTVLRCGGRINAIQIEITTPFRTQANKFEYLVEALANAMIHSVRRYAPF
jgi:hypothetical protein